MILHTVVTLVFIFCKNALLSHGQEIIPAECSLTSIGRQIVCGDLVFRSNRTACLSNRNCCWANSAVWPRTKPFCYMKELNGGWSNWTDWSPCSVACGVGFQTRSRSCTNPTPAGIGQVCTGSSISNQSCAVQPCRVDGGWTEFGPWSPCSVTCDVGVKVRTRNCTNPPPDEGKNCEGHSSDIAVCSNTPCIISEKSCSCHVGGDPIVETFNGKRLLLEGVGIFNIFTNGEPGSDEYIRVDVETFQKDWNYPAWIIINSVTVYYRDIAIHISTSSVTLSNDAGTLESDLSNELPYRDPTYDFLVNGTVGDTTSFMTSSGVKVILSSSDDISVEVMLPRDQLFSPVGACRTCDGDPSTDFILNGKDITNEPRKYLMMSRAFLVSDTLA